ncbi:MULTISPECIES: methyl-accepting chemotaxis protein [Clostridium]|uniref:methyl-accepting chemotaxis protein n=1 Tax=Clostridium TaxID=1485 RepID=UPI000826D6B5|nr:MULTISPECIES: methyl-accepting chemotaxis protein [Clostridium]PJI07608.1 chemotaxis protein [Clostridium sp. CT7]
MEKLKKIFNIKEVNSILKNTLFIGILILVALSIFEGVTFQEFEKIIKAYNSNLIMIPVCLAMNIILSLIVFVAVSKIIKNISNKLSNRFQGLQKGNFSFTLSDDEAKSLGTFAEPIQSLLDEFHGIIEGTYGLSKPIIQYSDDINSSANEATKIVEALSETIEEIANGATEQASEAQTGAALVENLSKQIDVVFNSCSYAINESEIIDKLNKECFETTNILNMKSSEYDVSSQRIFASIEDLINALNKIGLFAESITNIAEQTNLLALNASIEAARAGEQGKGFSVVADEVRKLAEQSRQSVEEINSLLNNIKQSTKNTTEDMNLMKAISIQQKEAVSATNISLDKISKSIDSIVTKINNVNNAVIQINNDKDSVISEIGSISAVTEQTAASTEELASTTQTQLDIFEKMRNTADKLNSCTKEMNDTLKKLNL